MKVKHEKYFQYWNYFAGAGGFSFIQKLSPLPQQKQLPSIEKNWKSKETPWAPFM